MAVSILCLQHNFPQEGVPRHNSIGLVVLSSACRWKRAVDVELVESSCCRVVAVAAGILVDVSRRTKDSHWLMVGGKCTIDRG